MGWGARACWAGEPARRTGMAAALQRARARAVPRERGRDGRSRPRRRGMRVLGRLGARVGWGEGGALVRREGGTIGPAGKGTEGMGLHGWELGRGRLGRAAWVAGCTDGPREGVRGGRNARCAGPRKERGRK
jgi:hypothetical protein